MAKTNLKTISVEQKTDTVERKKALEKALHKIEKDYGKGAVMRMSDNHNTDISAVSTGLVSLDLALGVGGYPKGRIIEVYGQESSGKTTLALNAVAEVQRKGGLVAYIDAENAMDPAYAAKLGVNIDEMYLSQPESGEQGLAIASELIESSAFSLVVIDSVAALVPKAEIEGEMGDSHVGLQARMMSQALRKISGNVNKTKVVVIFINQLREKVGLMFGNPETTPGGRALKFYASVRLEIKRTSDKIKEGTDQVGENIKVKVVKNKVAPPFKEVTLVNMYGKGMSASGDLLNYTTNKDTVKEDQLIQKSGSWFSYHDERIGQGRNNAIEWLDNHPKIVEKIRKNILANHDIKQENNLATE